ncbi:hypothetical protein HMPREF9554_02493 [Treponema phagedenis F0421]|nr:hypothetical protein HMPREF9554_02493 [Treponema phagedenis F0421]
MKLSNGEQFTIRKMLHSKEFVALVLFAGKEKKFQTMFKPATL